jgi:hypothetical protein
MREISQSIVFWGKLIKESESMRFHGVVLVGVN